MSDVSRINVLYLTTDAFGGHGGIALQSRDVIESLCADSRVESVTAIPRSQPEPLEPLPSKLTYDTSGVGGIGRYTRALGRVLFSRRPIDIVYCSHINLAPFAWLAAKIRRVPWILCIHGIDAWPQSNSLRRRPFAARADRIASVSALTLGRFLSWCPAPPDRCLVIPNAVHLEQFGVAPRNPALEARYGLAGRKVVMTFGRMDPTEQYKGFDEVIEILPNLLKQRDDIVYLIAGSGDDRARLEAKAAALGVGDQVIFTGRVAEEEKADTYRLADVYAMPSKGEGFGFVVLEAMACGVPAIASDQDGSQEAVRGGLLGQVIDPDRPEQLEAAILAVIDSPKIVPAGLDYFAFPAFRERIQALVQATIAERQPVARSAIAPANR